MLAFPRAIVGACLALAMPLSALRAQAPADSAGVGRAMHAFLEALNALDLQGMTTLFADDVTAFVPSAQAGQVTGKAAVTEIFRAFVDASSRIPDRKPTVPVGLAVTASGDLGYATFSVPTPAGVVRRRSFIWKRVRGAWRIAHFHASDVAPPA